MDVRFIRALPGWGYAFALSAHADVPRPLVLDVRAFLDLDPGELSGPRELDALLSFIERLAAATQKPVRMAPPSWPARMLLELDPRTGRWSRGLPFDV